MTERKDIPSGLAGLVYFFFVVMVSALSHFLALVLVVIGIITFIVGILSISPVWALSPVLIGIAWLLFYLGEEFISPLVIEWGNRTADRQKRNPKN